MGHAIVAGGKPDMAVPVTGIKASDIAVGSIVKLMEGGVATEYLVVNQGIPSGSSLYDASCDGLWLLRKDIKENRQWHSSNLNNYKNSTIHAWLNSDFFNQFGSVEQSAIKQVKIPYVNGTANSAVASDANGLSARIFLLSGYEVGWTQSNSQYFPIDGACLSYFSGTAAADSKRIGYLNGTAAVWWLRSPCTYNTEGAWHLNTNGGYFNSRCSSSYGIRPALILPSTALFDKTSLILKGVS